MYTFSCALGEIVLLKMKLKDFIHSLFMHSFIHSFIHMYIYTRRSILQEWEGKEESEISQLATGTGAGPTHRTVSRFWLDLKLRSVRRHRRMRWLWWMVMWILISAVSLPRLVLIAAKIHARSIALVIADAAAAAATVSRS